MMTFTAVTFAPVQSFIRSSRKLRDLYGSSLLLSHLARALHDDAEARVSEAGGFVISPAEVNSTRGVPNTLLIQGAYAKNDAELALLKAWEQALQACRGWLENLPSKKLTDNTRLWPPSTWGGNEWEQGWGASWKAVERHSWELFHGQGHSIQTAEEALSLAKQRRAWEIPNWTGESSTLSSAEAIVRPGMAQKYDPFKDVGSTHSQEARQLLEVLRQPDNLGEAFSGKNEEICLLELVKRLVTYDKIAPAAFGCNTKDILPERFRDLSVRVDSDTGQKPESIVWFMADGDKVGDCLQAFKKSEDEVASRRAFSSAMRQWAAQLYTKVPELMGSNRATIVYAGGDDILGALHETTPGQRDLSRNDLFDWLQLFPQLWAQLRNDTNQKALTASMGLVWADSQVPQREALQHVRDAEASAKARGRNRFALRLLYANGNHLEWTCPWDWLNPILHLYRDREGRTLSNSSNGAQSPTWRHLAEDLLWLEDRHAIGIHSTDNNAKAVAEGLLSAYFPDWSPPRDPEDHPDRRLDHWLIDLGRVMAGLERWRDGAKETSS
jgi:CRISPR-associated protein Cmr2